MKEMFNLKGKKALVTGSTQGIGFAIAKTLAEYGAKVYVNGATNEEKTKWLCDFENRIYNEIYCTHKCDIPFTKVAEATEDTELFVASPYDEMYLLYLCSMADFANAEYSRYNNDMAMLLSIYEDYERYFNNTYESTFDTLISG